MGNRRQVFCAGETEVGSDAEEERGKEREEGDEGGGGERVEEEHLVVEGAVRSRGGVVSVGAGAVAACGVGLLGMELGVEGVGRSVGGG